MLAAICLLMEPLGITGITYQKSPPRTMTFPPNGRSFCIKDCRPLSIASKAFAGAMGASSHMMTSAFLYLCASGDCPFRHSGDDASRSSGILKVLCAVAPVDNNIAAIPVHATHTFV